MQLTWSCLGADPLVLCFPKAARAKLAWSAGFTVAATTVALTGGTQVVVAVGRLPPESVISQSFAAVSEPTFGTRRLPSVHKGAGLLWRLGVVGWDSVQLTCDVELQERQGVLSERPTAVKETHRVEPNLAAGLVIEPEGVDDHMELLILSPGQELRP